MIDPTPPVSCRYGAPMGRFTGPEPSSTGERWHLARIPLDSGGYDRGGAYWGLGAPLYWARNGLGEESFFRLDSECRTLARKAAGDDDSQLLKWARDPERAAAKAFVRREWDSEARFYR